jgi:hypothetical protein
MGICVHDAREAGLQRHRRLPCCELAAPEVKFELDTIGRSESAHSALITQRRAAASLGSISTASLRIQIAPR